MSDTISETEITVGGKALVTGWDPEVYPNIIVEGEWGLVLPSIDVWITL